jgi:hypothetical protein
MTNLYKELDCPNYQQINQEISTWIDQSGILIDCKQFWNPLDLKSLLTECVNFSTWCRSHNLRLKSIAATVGYDTDCCGPHIDAPPARFKLSWPVRNTRDTWNCWYRSKVSSPKTIVNHLGGTIYTDSSELEEIQRREVITPAIIDAGVIHDVFAGVNVSWPRVVLQGQFFQEPTSI